MKNKKSLLVIKHPRPMVFIGINTGLLFVLNFFSGQLLSIFFSVPGLSGIVTGFTVPFFLCLTYLVTRGRGTFCVMWTLYSAAAIPTFLMGPPGPYKLIIGFMAGLSFDLVLLIIKKHNIGLYVGFIVYTLVMMALFLSCLHFFNLPGFDVTVKAVVTITVIFIVEGLISVYLATVAYKRIKNHAIDFSVID